MPGLVAFKRRWGIGSDDFVFPIIIENSYRIAWLIVLSVVFHMNKDAFDCTSGHLLRIYFIGVITLISASTLINIFIIHISMKGTIIQTAPRRRMPLLLYIKLAVMLPEALWLLLGTFWAFLMSYNCDPAVVWTVRGAVLSAWIAGFLMLTGIVVVFDPVGAKKQKERIARRMTGSELVVSDSGTSARRAWETRCRLICCCVAMNQDNNEAFTDVAKLIADFFQDVDLVPTDVGAGLVLIQLEQSQAASKLTSVVVGDSADGAGSSANVMVERDLPVPQNWMTIKMMGHFMKYALGSYGWPFFMYTNLCTGMCRLATKCKPSSSQIPIPRFLRPVFRRYKKNNYSPVNSGNPNIYKHGRWYEVLDDDGEYSERHSFMCCACLQSSDTVEFDNACQCHTAAIKKVTGISDQDLIYVSFHNKFKEIPFYVAVDRGHKSVVISIRGTLSLEDALVDMCAEGMTVDIEGVDDAYVHGGMLDCANYIKDKIETLQLIAKAFDTLSDTGRVVIVGHSLGAGVAAILSILMKPQFPDLICFSYSPPGGLMSPSISAHVRNYVCSVIVGKDVIPRLGMPTMNDLKMKVMKALDECHVPKYRILAKGCMRMICSCVSPEFSSPGVSRQDSLLENGSGAKYSSTDSETGTPDDALREAVMNPALEKKSWPMHPPGQILHIEEVEDRGSCGGTADYFASWAAPEDFNEILISPSMVLDHFPDVVLEALEQLHERNYIPRAKPVPTSTTA